VPRPRATGDITVLRCADHKAVPLKCRASCTFTSTSGHPQAHSIHYAYDAKSMLAARLTHHTAWMIHNAYANWLYPCHHSLLHSTATWSACRMYTASVIAQAIKIVAASALDTTATYSPSRSATAAVEACSPTSIMCPWRRWHSDTALSRPKSLSCCRKSRP
jgi:hypothetical protein